MYNHRIISFFAFATAFWVAEVLFMVVAWFSLGSILTSRIKVKEETKTVKEEETADRKAAIKKEEELADTDVLDLSDTPRTFPTYGTEPPLSYMPKVKDEDDEEDVLDETATQPLTAEADEGDEEDEESIERLEYGFVGEKENSGIGTSFSEGGERAGLARRRSRAGSRV